MTKYYDLYGTRSMTVEELQQAVGRAVDVSFQRRYSDDVGTYYTAAHGTEVFDVEPNFRNDGDEDAILEPEFADYPVLPRVSRSERSDEIRDLLLAIPGLEHLRRDTRD